MSADTPPATQLSETHIVGAELMVRNAQSLLSSAMALASSAKYGHATSLLILAAEEAVKAVLYYSTSNGLKIDPAGINEYKKKHKMRHGMAAALLTISSYIEREHLEFDDVGQLEKRAVDTLKRIVEDAKNEEMPDQIGALRAWWSGANDLKQKGMYVDEQPEGWSSPSKITKVDYDEAYEFVRPIIDAARLIRVLERSGYHLELKKLIDIDYTILAHELTMELQFVQTQGYT